MRLFISALLLVAGVFSFDCPPKACFGQPEGCVAGSSCRLVFKFDNDGSVALYLRDFVDPHAYAAFPIGENENETITYLICLPHSKTVLKATAKMGEPINVINSGFGNVTELGQNYFSCSYPSSELPKSFRRDKSFFITTGPFVDNLVIYDGHQLYSFDSGDDSSEDADYEPIYTEPISGTVKHGNDNTENVYTGDESKQANDAIDVIEKIANKNEESRLEDLELMLDSKNDKQNDKKVSRQNKIEEDDESLEDEQETTTRRPTRGHRKSSSIPNRRSSEIEDEGESDEDDDWEAAARELEKKDRKNQIRRRQNNDQHQRRSRNDDDEDEDEDRPRRKSPKRKYRNEEDDEDEEMEDDEEFDDDEDDSAINNFNIFLCTSIAIIVLGFTF